MRKLICILAMAAILFCAAQAEEIYTTDTDDLYYHVSAICSGHTGLTSTSAKDAQKSGKFPCPVCVPDDTQWQAGVAAVARGNTIIVRFADSWLAEPELTGVFGFASPETAKISEAAAFLAEDLHGEAYNRILQEIESGSLDATIIRTPAIVPEYIDGHDSITILSRRHIGNAWYYAIRPADPIGDTWNMYWRINGSELQTRGDEIQLSFTQQTVENHYPLSAPRFSDPAAFSRLYDGCQVDVFTDAGADVCANVAVITQFDADTDYLQNSVLCIGDQVRIPINGYLDGANGIFCCVLTDAEYACLAGGAKANIQPPDYMQDASFENSAYAVVRKGTGGTGIVDASGAFVVPPVYDYISRPSAESFYTTLPTPFFCTDYEGLVTVLDGATLNQIAQYAPLHDYLYPEYMNPSAFECHDHRGTRVLSLINGETLWDIPYDTYSVYSNGLDRLDGVYRCMADGYPTRMVAIYPDSARLLSLTGEAISDFYPRITPLIWKGDRGAFLVEVWDTDARSNDRYFERGKVLTAPEDNTGWRCGLMDESGKIIVPIEYASVEVTDDLTVIFRGAGDPVSITYA